MRLLVAVVVVAVTALAHADDAPPLPALIGVSATATSTLVTGKKTYEPWHVLARDPTRFWCEGKADEGVGEALVLTFAAPAKLASIAIAGGVWRDEALFRANNIPTKLDVTTDDGRIRHVVLPEDRTAVTAELGGAAVRSLTLAITAVTKGKLNDTCISGVTVVGEAAVVIGADPTALAALPKVYAKLYAALEDCTDDATLRDHVKLPLARKTTFDASTYKDLAAVRKACKAGKFQGFRMTDPKVRAEGPGAVVLEGYPAFWRLALDGGTWKLTRIEDGTP